MAEFKVGDRIRVKEANQWIGRFKAGDEFTVKMVEPNAGFGQRVHIGDGLAWCNNNRFELVEEEPALIPTPFLIVSEIPPGIHGQALGKPFVIERMYEMQHFNSLEEAQEHCDRLKELEGRNIHAYVRID